MIVGRLGHNERAALRLLQIAGLAICCLVAGCRAPEPKPVRNVVFIVVDTLRRDHLGVYGHSRDTSPSIDQLAAEGVRFDAAYATSGWTAPSIASMLTGLYPSAHGMVRPRSALAEEVKTLPEILRAEGFATAGVVSNRILGEQFGMAKGFDHFDETFVLGHRGLSTDGVTDKAIEMLGAVAQSGQRFFLFVHYFDPHYNYLRHDEYGFAAEREGRLEGAEHIGTLRKLSANMTPDEIDFLRDLYDGEIRFTDEGIGRLLSALRAAGHDDDTLIVFVSDHGEEFLERGWLGHTRTLYDELVRVPLILRLPDTPERRVIDERISLTSLAPTIIDLLDLERQADFPQASIAPNLAVRPPEDEQADVLSEVDFVPASLFNVEKTAKQESLVGPRFKLIRNALADRLELYDLELDPEERNDLAGQRPEQVRSMTRRLDALLTEARAGVRHSREVDLSEEDIRELQALGYGE